MGATNEELKEYYEKAIQHRIDKIIKAAFDAEIERCGKDIIAFNKEKFIAEATDKSKEYINVFCVIYNRAKKYFNWKYKLGSAYPLSDQKADCGSFCKQVLNDIGIRWPERYVPYDICYAKNNNNGVNWASSGAGYWEKNLWNENIWIPGDCDIGDIQCEVGDLIVVLTDEHIIMSDGDYGCFDAGSTNGVSHRGQWRPSFIRDEYKTGSGHIKTSTKIAEHIKSNNINEYDSSFEEYINEKILIYLDSFLGNSILRKLFEKAYKETQEELADSEASVSEEEMIQVMSLNQNIADYSTEYGWTKNRVQEEINNYVEEENLYKQFKNDINAYKETKYNIDGSFFDDLINRLKENSTNNVPKTESEYVDSVQNDNKIIQLKTEASGKLPEHLATKFNTWLDDSVKDCYSRYKELYEINNYLDNNSFFKSAYENILEYSTKINQALPENNFFSNFIQDYNIQKYGESYNYSDEEIENLARAYIEKEKLYDNYIEETNNYIEFKNKIKISIPNIDIVSWIKELDNKSEVKIAKTKDEFIASSLENKEVKSLENEIPEEITLVYKNNLKETIKNNISNQYEEYRKSFEGLDFDSIRENTKAKLESDFVNDIAKNWGNDEKSDYEETTINSLYNKAVEIYDTTIKTLDPDSTNKLLTLFKKIAKEVYFNYVVKTKEKFLSKSAIENIDTVIKNKIFDEKKKNINITSEDLINNVLSSSELKEAVEKEYG